MGRSWEPGTDYERGDVVKWHHRKFKCIQKHSSLGNWEPGVTPALWGMIEEDDSDSDDSDSDDKRSKKKKWQQPQQAQIPEYHRPQYQNDQPGYNPQYQATPYQDTQQQPPQYDNNQSYAHQGKPSQQPEEENKPGWFSEHKKELEIGGAVLGAIGVAGAGYNVMKHHKDSKDEQAHQNPQYHNDQGYAHQGKPHVQAEEQQKPGWFSEHKKELEVGAAVVGALGVAGVGYNAMKQHENSKHEVSVYKPNGGDYARWADESQPYQYQQDQQNPQHHSYEKPPVQSDEQKPGWFSEHKKELEVGAAVVGALGVAGVGYNVMKQHKNSNDEQHQAPQRYNDQDYAHQEKPHTQGEEQQKPGWFSEHKKELEVGAAVVGALGVAGVGYNAMKHKNSKDEQDQQNSQYHNDQGYVHSEKPHAQAEEQQKPGWFSEHKKELEVGAAVVGVLGVAGVGYNAMKQHKNSNDEVGYEKPPVQAEEQKPGWFSEHKKELEVGAAVVGALGVAGVGYNVMKHKNSKDEQDEQNPKHHNDQGYSYQEKPHTQAEERQKPGWFSEHKKELEIGGAVLGTLGAAGVGYSILKQKRENAKEEQEVHRWARDEWEKEAQIRTEEYRNGVRHGPATWVLTHGKNIPHDAIVVGPEHDWTLYICRAYHDGGRQLGKASQAFEKGAVIGYAHSEIQIDTFEVLVGDMNGLRWVPFSGRLNVQALNYKPVEGGSENDGTPLYIVKAPHNGFTHPGKTSEKLDGAYIPYGGAEKCVKEYSILCYN